MRVLIAGCGWVGTKLGEELDAAGHPTWGLKRDPSGLPSPLRPLQADLLDRESLPGLLPEVDAVVYATSADSSDPDAYRAAYVDGVRNLIEALSARSFPVSRFLFVSSTAVYGDAGGAWVDEETPAVPDGFRGEILREGEEAVLSSAFKSSVLRLGGIYGPGRTRLIDRVRSGEATCPEVEGRDDGTWSNRIHRDDAAGILSFLLEHPEPDPIYIGVDHEPARLCDVYTYVAELLDVSPPRRAPSPDRRRSVKRCSSRRVRDQGYRFRFPTFREGYRAIVTGGDSP
jgi:nucleoside-diphosphate-sugar epimerase